MKFNYLILSWFKDNKRDLPWRKTKNPYKIWLSEIILQQTKVEQGTKYYLNFIKEYESISDLANASEQEILKLWQGLGYYSRARNIHYTAKYISQELNSIFPDNFHDLKKLKGIGDYTAAAIASIVYNEAVPAVDGNMFRVFARYFNIDDDISLSKSKKIFWELGLEIIDKNNPGDFNQAIMDLGATVCTPKNPKCTICPLQNSCEALRLKKINVLPVKEKKIKTKTRYFNFYLIENEGKIAFIKRDINDIWGNLYTLPLVEYSSENERLEMVLQGTSILNEEQHILSHQKLLINIYSLDFDLFEAILFKDFHNFGWVKKEDIKLLPLPKPIEKFINIRFSI